MLLNYFYWLCVFVHVLCFLRWYITSRRVGWWTREFKRTKARQGGVGNVGLLVVYYWPPKRWLRLMTGIIEMGNVKKLISIVRLWRDGWCRWRCFLTTCRKINNNFMERSLVTMTNGQPELIIKGRRRLGKRMSKSMLNITSQCMERNDCCYR